MASKWQQVAFKNENKKLKIPIKSTVLKGKGNKLNIFDPGSGYDYKRLIINELSGVFIVKNSLVAPKVAVVLLSILIEPDYMSSPLPYRKAELIIPEETATDKRWYVKYYVWNAQQGKMIRKRDFKINSIVGESARKKWAKKFIDAINNKLEEGFHIDETKSKQQNLEKRAKSNQFISIKEATDLALKSREKLRAKTYKNYKDYLNGWLKRTDSSLHINTVTEKSLKPFLRQLSDEMSPRTYNNYLQHIATLFAYLVKEEIITENPWLKINKLKTGTGKNVAYKPDQQKQLLNYMEENWPLLKNYCEMMYYTLARPNEISHIQIKHIDMYRPKHLYIPEEISKNGHPRHVSLQNTIYKKMVKLKKLNPEWYLFGKGVKPGPEFLEAKYVSQYYSSNVLKKLGYSKDYTLYSWKHTGVVNNYIGGLSPASIRMQIGHTDTGSFEKYLKSLGLFENKEVMNNYVELEGNKKAHKK